MSPIMRPAAPLVVLLLAAACSDGPPLTPRLPDDLAPSAVLVIGPEESIFTSETPAQVLDAAPGWEVCTQFTPSVRGRVVGFRFWKAAGETGTHVGRLWNASGTQIGSATFTGETASGWQEVRFNGPFIRAGYTYCVSVNTNVKQAKTFGYLLGNPISSGNLYADFSYYGQPTGSLPTSGSYSTYFVDVIFREVIRVDPPTPEPNWQ